MEVGGAILGGGSLWGVAAGSGSSKEVMSVEWAPASPPWLRRCHRWTRKPKQGRREVRRRKWVRPSPCPACNQSRHHHPLPLFLLCRTRLFLTMVPISIHLRRPSSPTIARAGWVMNTSISCTPARHRTVTLLDGCMA